MGSDGRLEAGDAGTAALEREVAEVKAPTRLG
jgi:hypothetical protein